MFIFQDCPEPFMSVFDDLPVLFNSVVIKEVKLSYTFTKCS